jgi:hypothetical protein
MRFTSKVDVSFFVSQWCKQPQQKTCPQKVATGVVHASKHMGHSKLLRLPPRRVAAEKAIRVEGKGRVYRSLGATRRTL